MSKKTVVIVREGTWGGITQERKDEDVAMLKRVLETPTVRFKTGEPNKKEEQRADVEIVATTDDARKRLVNRNPLVDVVVFDSAVNISDARALKRERPRLTVVVLTGMIPKDEVLILSRDWLDGGKDSIETMQSVILDTNQG